MMTNKIFLKHTYDTNSKSIAQKQPKKARAIKIKNTKNPKIYHKYLNKLKLSIKFVYFCIQIESHSQSQAISHNIVSKTAFDVCV